jgi:hypothetical protein
MSKKKKQKRSQTEIRVIEAVITELQHYKALEAQGILYEPNF